MPRRCSPFGNAVPARGRGELSSRGRLLGQDARVAAIRGLGAEPDTLADGRGRAARTGLARGHGWQPLDADLFYDETWNDRIAALGPAVDPGAGSRWQDDAGMPGSAFRPGTTGPASTSQATNGSRGAVRVGNSAFPFGPISAAINPEWSFDPARVAELKTLSTRTGGSERVDLSDAWRAERPPAWRGIETWLLVALLLALIIEAWVTRTGGWRAHKTG